MQLHFPAEPLHFARSDVNRTRGQPLQRCIRRTVNCSSMVPYLSRDLPRCSFLLLFVTRGAISREQPSPSSGIFHTVKSHRPRIVVTRRITRPRPVVYTCVINKWYHKLRTFCAQLHSVYTVVIQSMYVHKITIKAIQFLFC